MCERLVGGRELWFVSRHTEVTGGDRGRHHPRSLGGMGSSDASTLWKGVAGADIACDVAKARKYVVSRHAWLWFYDCCTAQ